MLQMLMNSDANNGWAEPEWLVVLKQQIESLRFGTVQVVVHEGRVVQLEKAEKVRFEGSNQSTSTAHRNRP